MAVLRTGLGLQAAVTALFALALLVSPGVSAPLYVSLSGLAMAGILLASGRLSSYLKVFVSVYGVGYLFLAGAKQLAVMGFLPPTLAALLPPSFAATGAVDVHACPPKGTTFETLNPDPIFFSAS